MRKPPRGVAHEDKRETIAKIDKYREDHPDAELEEACKAFDVNVFYYRNFQTKEQLLAGRTNIPLARTRRKKEPTHVTLSPPEKKDVKILIGDASDIQSILSKLGY